MSTISPQDEAAITRTLIDYCWAIDEKDWALMRDTFTAEAELNMTTGPLAGADTIVDFMRTSRARFSTTQHILSNVRITPGDDGRTAYVTSYVLGHDVKPGTPDALVRIAAQYRDHVVKDSDRWRISQRDIVRIWLDPH